MILLPLVNGEGFYSGSKQVVPSDGKNINRVFPPPEEGTPAQEVARTVVEQIYPEGDFLLDLHGGDVNEAMTPLVFYPATAAPEVTDRPGRPHSTWKFCTASPPLPKTDCTAMQPNAVFPLC